MKGHIMTDFLLHTDHSFHIGEQHRKNGTPCQDYADSGSLKNGYAYAIVADGCSSGGRTDIGARLMVLATKAALETVPVHIESDYDLVSVVKNRRDAFLETYCRTLQLDYHDLLATCLFALAAPDWVFTHIDGDGVIGIKYEHDLDIEYTEWADNCPYYPAYDLANMNELFIATHQKNPEPYRWVLRGTAPIGQGGVADGLLSDDSVAVGMLGKSNTHSHAQTGYHPGNICSIGLFSDGAGQVDQVEQTNVVENLLDFKNTNGRFVTRRLNRFLKEAEKDGRGAIDDIAAAVITFIPNQESQNQKETTDD